jgi:hypothetical protein
VARPLARRGVLGVARALLCGLCRSVIRAVITALIFALCLAAALRYMGVPVPGPAELLDKFESVSKLAEILS